MFLQPVRSSYDGNRQLILNFSYGYIVISNSQKAEIEKKKKKKKKKKETEEKKKKNGTQCKYLVMYPKIIKSIV